MIDNSQFAESGVIKEVNLINFQSHSNFHIEFGPNVNFVIGLNGSGKSSILQAICVAFGATGKQTGRSAKLDGLVKAGETHATVTVVVKNEGQNAYRPQEFGTEIRVERTIKTVGTSGWKLKNDRDKEVKVQNSTPKQELQRIMSHFNIRWDNPCVIMTQDVSKEFLKNTNAAKMFLFFEQATLLEDMRQQHEIAGDKKEGMQGSFENLVRTKATVEAELAEIKKKHDAAMSIEDFKKKKGRHSSCSALGRCREA